MIHAVFAYLDSLPRKLGRMNLLLMIAMFVLLMFGVLFIFSAGQQTGGRIAGYWIRQLVWILAGTLMMVFLMGMDYEVLGRTSLSIYIAILGLLILVLIIGPKINGAQRWILLPGMTIQPSEFAKLGALIPLAWFASFPSTDLRRFSHVLMALIIMALPVALVVVQPDLGSALVFIPISLTILFLGGIRWRLIFFSLLVGLVAGPMVYKLGLHPYQKKRVLTFLKPIMPEPGYKLIESFSMAGQTGSKERTAIVIDDWNALQSELAVGSGSLHGKGFGKGTQNTLGFLPRRVAPTDFIFSVIGEETGFLGSCMLLLAFTVLLLTSVYIGARARDDFGRYLACAIAALIGIHVFINIAMTIRLMPITGVPLPFVSYGGSVMMLMMSCIGILQSIYIHRDQK